MSASEVDAEDLGDDVTVTICPDGPLLLRGPAQLRTVDGSTVDHDRTVLALCRCGRSRLKPLCDGSHRLSHFRDPATADQLDHVLTHATPYGRSGPGGPEGSDA